MTSFRPPALALALIMILVMALPAVAEDAAVPADPQTSTAQQSEGEEAAWAPTGTTATTEHIADVIGSSRGRTARYTGAGVGVALIDTGVAPVEGLTDVVNGPDLSLDAPIEPVRHLDVYGHGTHLAGLITSDRADATGIAPDSTLVSLKVGASNGAVDTSQVIAAIDWVVQHRDEHNIRVLVLAYGTDSTQSSEVDPLMHAVEVAWRNGITVVASAGNQGEDSPTITSPARDPYVIAVGAIDTQGTSKKNDDTVPSFSASGDDTRRPDLLAPGVGVVSSAVPGSYLNETYPQAQRPGDLLRGNGTSQATAITGAAVALLLQARPELTPDEVKAILIDNARRVDGQRRGEGPGVLDVRKITTDRVPGDATQTWPVSTGTGSLELARGSQHLLSVDGTRTLTGEVDVHGQPFDASSWSQAATELRSWESGTWNATQWTSTGWTDNAWGGISWGGISWGGQSWDGISWGGISWGGISWGGISWGGISWGGISWGGQSWA